MSDSGRMAGDDARSDATRSSVEVIGFLVAYAMTLGACGLLGLYATPQQTALATLVQGGIALPLVIRMVLTQRVALPAVFIVFGLDPTWVPAAFAAIAGGHFLPYAWVHRTKLYLFLGVAVAVVPAGIRWFGGPTATPYCLLAWSTLCLLGAILVRSQVAGRALFPSQAPACAGSSP